MKVMTPPAGNVPVPEIANKATAETDIATLLDEPALAPWYCCPAIWAFAVVLILPVAGLWY